jgi:hypothetical protein
MAVGGEVAGCPGPLASFVLCIRRPGGKAGRVHGREVSHTVGPAPRIREPSEEGQYPSRARPWRALVEEVRRLPDRPATTVAPGGASTASAASGCRGLSSRKAVR